MTIIETDREFYSDQSGVRVSKATAGVHFQSEGSIAVAIVANESLDYPSHVSLYGTPEGLLALADLLTAFAKLDQDQVDDRNCPNGEGVHTTIPTNQASDSEKIQLHVGRLDAKGTGSSDWFTSPPRITIVKKSDR